MNDMLNQHEFNPYSNVPQEMLHYWHAFMLTKEYSSVLDDWNMYCMGHQI